MTIRNLEHMLAPKSIALIGASSRDGSLGRIVARNLLRGGFRGPVWLVNPKYQEIDGAPCYASVAALPEAPELAVVATPPDTIPGVIAELGARGTRAAVVITAGIRADLRQAMLNAAKPHILRIQGPNCLGLMVPGLGLDALQEPGRHLRGGPGGPREVPGPHPAPLGTLDALQERGDHLPQLDEHEVGIVADLLQRVRAHPEQEGLVPLAGAEDADVGPRGRG